MLFLRRDGPSGSHQALGAGEGQSGIDVVIRDITYLGDSTNFAVETGWRQVIAVRLPFGLSVSG